MRVLRSTVAIAVLWIGCAALASSSASAATATTATNLKIVSALVGTQSITASTRDNPVKIDPHVRTTLSMTLQNNGTEEIHVRYLRLSGAVIGIHFVNYQASTNVDIAPGATSTVSTPGDFFDVDGVATGLVNAQMQVVDENRNSLVGQEFVADVKGKVTSSEGILFFELLALAVISFVDIAIGVSRRRLPKNRFICGILFAFAAVMTVLAIVIVAAMARIALFETTAWVPALLVATAGSFILGYISPSRMVRTAPEKAEDKVIDLVAAGAVARATGDHERRTTGEVAAHQSGDHTAGIAGLDLTASHHSGEFTAAPAHESGEFTAAPAHESGSHEPVDQDSAE